MVSEFQKVIHIPVDQPIPPLSRLLSTPSLGEIASEGFKTVGVHRSPADFVKEALEVKHPSATVSQLPAPMLAAVHRAATEPVESLCQTRSEALRMMLAKAKEFQPAEEELKQSLSARRKEVLKGKRLVLFQWLLEQSGSTDTRFVTDLCNGFDLTGTLPESNTFSKRFRPAQLPTDTLRGVAEKARMALLSNIRSSGDVGLDHGVYEATRSECDKGFLVGPVDPDGLPEGATLTRRFGVAQKDKIRPIDDYRASMVNSSVTQAEAVSIHGVDHIAAMCAEYLRCSSAQTSQVELVAKCWDLASAYKQALISQNRPRLVDTNFFEWVHLYVDASYDPGNHSGVGGMLLDQSGNCLCFFSEPVPSNLVDKIKAEDQKTIIFELEGLAVAIGIALFSNFLLGKRLIVFTDNQAVQAQSNPADILSREVVMSHLGVDRTKVDLIAMWHQCTTPSHVGEERDGCAD
ncbi:unnamed protein product [Cladocopium goreaui]|uniref:RNase H type-1 domain-containing protein n=1 Tax=Cladocopium goreaui TaxID=2562237 RepID=A0A9P1DEX0_9DINO|nr:unnamed protein product [Cladocopium goreaui]